MSGRAPSIAVVTASRDRHDALLAKARSLAEQTLAGDAFEWSIWLNESADAVDRLRRAFETQALPFAWRIEGGHDHPVGLARNLAAAASSAPLLLISDDDCTHDPGALAAHVAFHDALPDAVGIGPLRLPGSLRAGTRREPFERRPSVFGRAPWIQATGANTSLPRAAFEAVGGYDPAWTGYGGEDPELALRLLAHGLRFRHVPAGAAEHHGRVLDDADKAYRAGRAHVRVARRHPRRGARWWLGVHPVLLAVKRGLYAGPLRGLFDANVRAYELAYAQGARDEARGQSPGASSAREENA